MEFTRLAQITKESKYYDAIARITDEFEDWQKRTRLPGMWPDTVDASGCDDPVPAPGGAAEFYPETGATNMGVYNEEAAKVMVPLKKPPPLQFDLTDDVPSASSKNVPLAKPDPLQFGVQKRDVNYLDDSTIPTRTIQLTKRGSAAEMAQVIGAGRDSGPNWSGVERDAPAVPSCTSPGLNSMSEYATEKYTLGGQADSMYEYLPKMYLLLGGRVPKYQPLYEKAADMAIDKLIFRPMTPQNHDILISGTYVVPGKVSGPSDRLIPEGSHLTCFVGGMFALGAKMFNRNEDLNLAAKLTDGCVWAYNSTATGIMPEGFTAIPCESKSRCAWNETAWYDALDPYYENRMESYRRQIEQITKQAEAAFEAKTKAAELALAKVAEDTNSALGATKPDGNTKSLADRDSHSLEKRQLDHSPKSEIIVGEPASPGRTSSENTNNQGGIYGDATTIRTEEDDDDDAVYIPPAPPSHEEYVKTKIEDERLPLGMTTIGYKKYILRYDAPASQQMLHMCTELT